MVAHSMVELLDKKDIKAKKPWPWPDNYTLKLEELISGIINKESAAIYSGGESITLSNGLIIKGKATLSVTSGGTISFETAFPNALRTVTATPTSETQHGITSASASGFVFRHAGGGAETVRWIAIGH